MADSYRTLIVDDSIAMRGLLVACLDGSEFEVIGQAEDGKMAIDQFQALNPDLVLCDIVMPEMTGTEALARILELNPQAFVVMASSMGSEKAVEESLDVGAKGFIQKPFDQAQVLATLRSLM